MVADQVRCGLASDLGVRVSDIAGAVRLMMSGDDEVSTFKEGSEQYPVTIRLMPGQRDDPAVLGEMTSWFNSRESRFWGPLRALSYDRVAETGFRPWGDDFIPRRFCSGRILLNNGVYHRVDYSVRENLGLFGLTWNVNWCVSGLDRLRSYAPDCQMARP